MANHKKNQNPTDVLYGGDSSESDDQNDSLSGSEEQYDPDNIDDIDEEEDDNDDDEDEGDDEQDQGDDPDDPDDLKSDASSSDSEQGEGEEEDDNCIYKYAGNNSDDEDDDNEELEFSDDEDVVPDNKIVPKELRITKPFLTKYERVRLIGDRTKQLAEGAKPLIKNAENIEPEEIAKLELQHNIIPLIIERPLPNGKKERWHVSELSK